MSAWAAFTTDAVVEWNSAISIASVILSVTVASLAFGLAAGGKPGEARQGECGARAFGRRPALHRHDGHDHHALAPLENAVTASEARECSPLP